MHEKTTSMEDVRQAAMRLMYAEADASSPAVRYGWKIGGVQSLVA
jgi:hypothetical protein